MHLIEHRLFLSFRLGSLSVAVLNNSHSSSWTLAGDLNTTVAPLNAKAVDTKPDDFFFGLPGSDTATLGQDLTCSVFPSDLTPQLLIHCQYPYVTFLLIYLGLIVGSLFQVSQET